MTHPEFIDDKVLRTAADRVFEALQDAIVRGEIPPGSRVGETELAERYGTSRGPLREALRRLESRPHPRCDRRSRARRAGRSSGYPPRCSPRQPVS